MFDDIDRKSRWMGIIIGFLFFYFLIAAGALIEDINVTELARVAGQPEFPTGSIR